MYGQHPLFPFFLVICEIQVQLAYRSLLLLRVAWLVCIYTVFQLICIDIIPTDPIKLGKAFCHEKGVIYTLSLLSVADHGVVLGALNLLVQITSISDKHYNPLMCKIVVASGTGTSIVASNF